MVERVLIGYAVLNGIFVAFCTYYNIQLPISPINALCVVLFLICLAEHLGSLRQRNTNASKFFLAWRSALLLFTLVKLTSNAIFDSRIQLTDLFYFALFYIGISLLDWGRKFSPNRALKAQKTMVHLSGVIVVISFVQYFFYQELPNAFTDIPNIHKEVNYTRYLRDLGSIQIYRPNGLIGNPINLGLFLNIAYMLVLNTYKEQSVVRILALNSIVILVVLLASRANITIMIIQLLLFSSFRQSLRLKHLLVPSILLIYLLTTPAFSEFLTFIFDRFWNSDEYAAASTAEHISDYLAALNYISNNPFFGINPAEVFSRNIITDGSNFFFLLVYGVPFSVLYLVFICICASLFWLKNAKSFACWVIIIFIYGFLNSAILNKSIFLLFHLYLGLRLAHNEQQQ